MMQNFGSKPKMSCHTVIDVEMIIAYFFENGFNYSMLSRSHKI
jgi:hypothetical protein